MEGIGKMKEIYTKPEMEVVEFEIEDVITTSNEFDNENQEW